MDEPSAKRLQLREATLDDLPLLADLNRQLQEDERTPDLMSLEALEARMKGWLAAHYRTVLFEIANDLVAYALYRPSEDGLYMRQFFVLRAHRRQGVGRAAMNLFRAKMIQPDQILSLEAYTHNARAIAFYRKIGFLESTVLFQIEGPGNSTP